MKIMAIEYRLLTPEDASDYRELRLLSYREAPYAFSESFEDEQHRPLSDFAAELNSTGDPPEWFVLGVYVEEYLGGFVKFRRDQRSKARHKSMIHAMYIHPDQRGKDLGRGIIQALLDRVTDLPGLEQIHLWVLHADGVTSAAGFYHRLGWISQGPRVQKDLLVDDTYIDAEYMVMYLS